MQFNLHNAERSIKSTVKKPVRLMMITLSLLPPAAWSAELVEISSLINYPEDYMLKVVQVEGTIRNYHMDHFIGKRSKLEKCFQKFSIEDEGGSYAASYATICNMGGVMLQEGDRVTIEGLFQGTRICKPNVQPGDRGCIAIASKGEGGTPIPLEVRSVRKH